jgi:hypothetical protein
MRARACPQHVERSEPSADEVLQLLVQFHAKVYPTTIASEGDMTTESFARRIKAMNAMYRLPAHEKPTLPADTADRLRKFKATLLDEVHEIDDIIAATEAGASPLGTAVAIADLLGDIIVYCRSEALKYGIPLEAVLDIIMDSNESKLGADGNPIYDANGKFLKGPNYWKPEPRIQALLAALGEQQ